MTTSQFEKIEQLYRKFSIDILQVFGSRALEVKEHLKRS
jgi:hypothetical protein